MKQFAFALACLTAVSWNAVQPVLAFPPPSPGITLTLRNTIGGLDRLNGIDVDPAGNIYVVRDDSDTVQSYTQDGQLRASFATVSSPGDVLVHSSGFVFVTSSWDSSIAMHAADSLVLHTHIPISNPRPWGIAELANGNLAVTDYSADTIYTYPSSGGRPITSFSSLGPWPNTVAIDANGDFLVGDTVDRSLSRFTSSGQVLNYRLFHEASGVDVDDSGTIYLADGGSGFLRVLDRNFNVISENYNTFEGNVAHVEDVAWAPNGRVIANIKGKELRVFDTSVAVQADSTISNTVVTSGNLGVSNGQAVSVTGSFTTGSNVNNGGTVSVDSGGRVYAETVNNSGVFEVNGNVNVTNGFNNQAGGTLKGNGTVNGSVTVQSGSTVAPGLSPGTMNVGSTTFAAGGIFQLEVNDFAGSAGTDPGWDLLAVNGTLNITATAGNPFVIDLDSLTLANVTGDAANFADTSNFTLTFVTTTAGITGFAANLFSIDTSGFTNAFTGNFSVAQMGNNLALQYTSASAAVPEPSSLVILGATLGGYALRYRRRQRSRRREETNDQVVEGQ